MKMERVNAWLGLAGNVAILLGLVFLAIEIRSNTEAVRAQELANFNAINRQRQLLMASEPDMRDLYVKSLYSPSELTLSELWGVINILAMRVDLLRAQYQAYQNGTITLADWESSLRLAPIFIGGKFGRLFWDTIKADFASTGGFVAEVDDTLAENTIIADDKWLLHLQGRITESGL